MTEEPIIDPIYDLRFNINYYGADYPIDTLVRRMQESGFIIPNYQRQYVWKPDEASKFIESLLLGLPVPSLFFAKDKFSNQLIVIDGQQRLRTLQFFYEGAFPDNRPFKLRNVSLPFEGLGYQDLSPEDKTNLDNTIIHCIIVAENEGSNRIFYLFERLNTTGTPLNSQEIRNALYHGPFNDLLFELGDSEVWKHLYRQDEKRLEHLELILRFFALHFSLEDYSGNMNQFLNDFMLRNRDFTIVPKQDLEKIFYRTMNLIFEEIGKDAFYVNNKFNRVMFETFAVTVSREFDKIKNRSGITILHQRLIESGDFWEFARSSTTSKRNVSMRFELVQQFLAGIVHE